MICFGIILIVLVTFFVSAGCCEKTIDGHWCQDTTEDQCETNFLSTTSCAQTTFCTSTGTCVDSAKGTCKENSYEVECTSGGGKWENKDKEDIVMCQEGCCIVGDSADLKTYVECKQLASDYGIDINFREDVRSLNSCFDLGYATEKGACVYERNYATKCEFITKEDCQGIISSSPSTGTRLGDLFGGEEESETIEKGTFNSGLLCTAPGLSDCAVNSETTCYNKKVYFVDTCGQRANIYDSSMYTENENAWTKEMRDYWTYIQEPTCTVSRADADCGNCEFLAGGTTCGTYKRGEQGMPTQQPLGDYVCKDLACYYDVGDDGKEERYEHGESVCAESEGTYFHIPQIDSEIEERGASLRIELSDMIKYNLPGSRYYRLQCWNGEMKPYACKEYRNEICEEIDLGEEYMEASCVINDYRGCFEIEHKEDCEDDFIDCKWVPGYRYDGEVVDFEDREEEQGSCVPLYTPGFDFWEPESDGHVLCAASAVAEVAVYETHWKEKRTDFKDVDTKNAAQRCLENCYTIPGYGDGLTLAQVKGYYDGEELNNVKNYPISLRRGHYCHDKNDPDDLKLGSTTTLFKNRVDCASDNKKQREAPLFYTHEQYLDSVKIRGKSLGDCGTKNNFVGTSGQDGAELITVIFQELTQDGSIKKNGSVEIIWMGDKEVSGYREDGKLQEDVDDIDPSWEY